MTNTDPSFRLAKMTSPEVRAQIVNGRTTVVVPFGAVEQHGPHLPLATDAILGDHLGAMIAERLNGFCAPTIPIGCSKHHVAFPGTLSIRPETLRMIVHDLVESLVGHGFRRIVLLRTHGGNEEPLKRAATESKRDGVTIVVPSLSAIVAALLTDARARGLSPGDEGGHAGELETSLMLALAPHLVRTGLMEPGYTGPLDQAATNRLFREGAAALSANGVLGDPRGSSPATGQVYVAGFVDTVQAQLPQ